MGVDGGESNEAYLLPWVAVILKAQYHRVLGCFKCTLERVVKGARKKC